ncbi:hypothetical protein [Nocardioides sp. Iso805N]|uniref:hypothetical protein n=1 Tax=Nocardioides sp. Iso805N TaxID=1283287 RepID=UPI0012FB9FF0|nr:hypothetical protein [Nocardioides sp. Iso805N]
MTSRTRGILVALILPATMSLALGACGSSSSSGRPSTDDISDSLQHGKAASLFDSGTAIPAKTADCMAKALHDSKLSDKTLEAFVKGDKDYKGSKADATALSDLGTTMSSCVTAAK